MKNKCKICGYHFKSKDEVICPECFTAREDDISCGRYSHSEHSHEIFGDRYTRDASEFDRLDETFEEDKSSFAEQERKEEQNSKFSKIERIMNSSSSSAQSFVPPTSGAAYNNSSQYQNSSNGSTSGFPRQTVNQFYSNGTVRTAAAIKKNPGFAKPLAVFVIIVVVINLLSSIFTFVTDVFNDEDTDYTYDEQEYDEDEDDYLAWFEADENYAVDTSLYPDYSVNSAYTLNDSDNLSMTQNYVKASACSLYDVGQRREQYMITNDYIDESDLDSGYAYPDDPNAVYKIGASYTFSGIDCDELEISEIACVGYDSQLNILSIFDMYYDDSDFIITHNDDGSISVYPYMFCCAESDTICVLITAYADGEEADFCFYADKSHIEQQ